MSVTNYEILAQRQKKVIYKDGDTVLKVFDNDYSKADILNEALNQARIEETGLNVPKLLEVSKIDGKWAIRTEYIPGKTLAQLMEENPDKLDEYLDLFIDIQKEIFSKEAPLLNKIKDKFNRKISASRFDATTRYELHTRLESMKNHKKICHGDFTPSNIIITPGESYYILDAAEEASVYLGLRQDADPGQMFAELERANRGECLFDAEKYVNRFPARKHDHFLIPAGTCHGAGSGTMVLEISATPYIFTFKLWDWGRLGLDGKPRPVHLEHGRQVLRTDRKYEWVKKNLVNAVHIVNDNDDYTEEHTGLHELEFIETRRYTIRCKADLDTEGSVNMLNLVEGSAAVIESPAGGFEPYTVHYAETFILPAKVGPFTIRPANKDETIIVIRAHVRT